MKVIGVIGGLGPETTAKYYNSLMRECRNIDNERYPSVIIHNIPLPFTVENDFAVLGKNESAMLPYLINSAKLLERAGAEFGVIPCNTAHIFIDQVRCSVNIPFLNLIEETIHFVKNESITNVALLATSKTISSGLYSRYCEATGINVLVPHPEEQILLSGIIARILQGQKNQHDKEVALNILNTMHGDGAEAVILGCTDLQLLLNPRDTHLKVIDTLEVLVKASAREIF